MGVMRGGQTQTKSLHLIAISGGLSGFECSDPSSIIEHHRRDRHRSFTRSAVDILPLSNLLLEVELIYRECRVYIDVSIVRILIARNIRTRS